MEDLLGKCVTPIIPPNNLGEGPDAVVLLTGVLESVEPLVLRTSDGGRIFLNPDKVIGLIENPPIDPDDPRVKDALEKQETPEPSREE